MVFRADIFGPGADGYIHNGKSGCEGKRMTVLMRIATRCGALFGALAGRWNGAHGPGRDEPAFAVDDSQWRRMELLNRVGTAALRETDEDVLLAETAREVCRLLRVPRCTIR